MQAMPDNVIKESNGIQRFEGPGRFAKDLDLNSKAITDIISTMAAKGIYSDPTMVAFEALYVPENGDLSPAFAPFVGTMPPATERGFRTGGFAVPKDLSRADYRASWAKMVACSARCTKPACQSWRAPTARASSSCVNSRSRWSRAYTCRSAGHGDHRSGKARGPGQGTGSIKAGKVADLVLVEGDPRSASATCATPV